MSKSQTPHSAVPARLQPKKSKAPRLVWDNEMELALLEGLKEQEALGKRAESGWKSEAWAVVVEAIQAVSPSGTAEVAMAKGKSKIQDFKKQWQSWEHCLSISGFGWDEGRQCITASDEDWEKYIEVSI